MTTRSTFPPDDDEDTLELELTAEERRRLSRAAREAHPAKGRYPLWSVSLAAALVGVAVSIAWRPSPPRPVAQRMAAAPAPARPPPAASEPAVLAPPQSSQAAQVPPGRPVRVRNPFDPQEVFEFPAGTTKGEAQEKVSALLLQRAVDRRGQGKGIETGEKPRARND